MEYTHIYIYICDNILYIHLFSKHVDTSCGVSPINNLKEKRLPASPMNERTRQVACVSSSDMFWEA